MHVFIVRINIYRLGYEYSPIGWLGLSLGPPRPREPFLLLFTSRITLITYLSASYVTSSRLSLGYEYSPIGWLGLPLGPPRPREPFLLLFTSRITLITYLSASYVTGLRVYSSPLFFDFDPHEMTS